MKHRLAPEPVVLAGVEQGWRCLRRSAVVRTCSVAPTLAFAVVPARCEAAQ